MMKIEYLDIRTRQNIQLSPESLLNFARDEILPALNDYSKVILVGEIQSGKTGTYLALIELLSSIFANSDDRLHRFTDVIVLAGNKKTLLDQTLERLRPLQQLGIGVYSKDDIPIVEKANSLNVFVGLKNVEQLRTAVEFISVPSSRSTPHYRDNASRRVLIVDDECDQAGLNTFAHKNMIAGQSNTSSVHRALAELVETATTEGGCYLGCTATPVGNLLIASDDPLTVERAVVMQPHEYYSGITDFPHTPTDELSREESIYTSLAYFVLSAAAESLRPGWNKDSRRAMMIHSDTLKDMHLKDKDLLDAQLYRLRKDLKEWFTYSGWSCLESTVRRLFTELAQSPEDHKRYNPNLLEITRADDGSMCASNEVGNLARNVLRESANIVKKVKTFIVNMDHDSTLWQEEPYPVIIGASLLNRGLTIEDLSVSLFLRTPKSTNSTPDDTKQQWARFCGPRAEYIQYCRVFCSSDLWNAFRDAVQTETELRKSLSKFGSLTTWRREFYVSGSTKHLVRKSIVGRDLPRLRVIPGVWNTIRQFDTNEVRLTGNARVFNEFRQSIEQNESTSDSANVPLGSLIRLLSYLVAPLGSQALLSWSDIGSILGKVQGTEYDNVRIWFPGPRLVDQERSAFCTVSSNNGEWGVVKELFSGQSGGTSGERNLRSESELSLHLRMIYPTNNGRRLTKTPELLGSIFSPENALHERLFPLEILRESGGTILGSGV